MLRSMFRVVVVASVVFSFTVFAVPSVQAGPSKGKAAAAKAGPSLLQAVAGWLIRANLGPTTKGPGSAATVKQKKGYYGSCIDPWGQPRPCS